jgi:hypothetical protein
MQSSAATQVVTLFGEQYTVTLGTASTIALGGDILLREVFSAADIPSMRGDMPLTCALHCSAHVSLNVVMSLYIGVLLLKRNFREE